MINNGFIIEPYYELLPDYKICPFSNKDMHFNRNLPASNLIDEYFKNRFKNKTLFYTLNGREAINIALKHYGLKETDVVTILTTTNNFYISSCVTKEIEKFCKWSRQIESNTKIIFVNHEFGYPYQELLKLKELHIPIIEDCAHTFFSTNQEKSMGEVGDFVIYSFPKIFPIQVGGLLVINNIKGNVQKNHINEELLVYIKKVLSFYINESIQIKSNRISNYNWLSKKFETLGFMQRFELNENAIPGVFMFKVEENRIDLVGLKKYFYANGIQCSQFYGENTFFIPCHQNLNEGDLEYFTEVLISFINKNN
jgi:dTDP-4-amino-4,6-dideoxygalactose transaminase